MVPAFFQDQLQLAVRENSAARVADHDHALMSAKLNAQLLDDDQTLEQMSLHEVRTQASIFRSVAAYALSGAANCERFVEARMKQAAAPPSPPGTDFSSK